MLKLELVRKVGDHLQKILLSLSVLPTNDKWANGDSPAFPPSYL